MALNEQLRDQILESLSVHFSQDRLGLEEYEQRVQAVNAARNDQELMAVNMDLLSVLRSTGGNTRMAAPGTNHPAGIQASPEGAMVNYGDAPKKQDLVAIFSGSDMAGEFLAPRRLDSVSIFGGANIDLRKAAIPADGMEIEVAAIFGGCTILLPAGVNPEITGMGIFGGFNKPRASYGSSGPRLRINGVALFGGVDIRIQGQGQGQERF